MYATEDCTLLQKTIRSTEQILNTVILNAVRALISDQLSMKKKHFYFIIPKVMLSTKLREKELKVIIQDIACVVPCRKKKLLEVQIVGKMKIGFTMIKDEVKGDGYNFMKETSRKIPVLEKQPRGKRISYLFIYCKISFNV